jgi:4-hydroxy-tetrahydrodipicolinate synthase
MSKPKPLRMRGVLAPVVTPFKDDFSIHQDLFTSHCRALVAEGVGLALFGTNSEATSVSAAERMESISHLLTQGVPADRMMPGTGCCSIAETVELTRFMLANGIHRALMLPPYFYKEADDDGLFAYFSAVIERLGSNDLQVYLYNIPQYTQVRLSPELVGRLLARYPNTVAGYKDSSGDWGNTKAMLERYAANGFDVFSGSESLLSEVLRNGGAGCISATANVNPAGIQRICAAWGTEDALAAQEAANKVRAIFQSKPMIAAMKRFLAGKYDKPDWQRLRPPLSGLSNLQRAELDADLASIGMVAQPS